MKRLLLAALSIPLVSVAIYAQTPKCNSTLLKHAHHPTRLIVDVAESGLGQTSPTIEAVFDQRY